MFSFTTRLGVKLLVRLIYFTSYGHFKSDFKTKMKEVNRVHTMTALFRHAAVSKTLTIPSSKGIVGIVISY